MSQLRSNFLVDSLTTYANANTILPNTRMQHRAQLLSASRPFFKLPNFFFNMNKFWNCLHLSGAERQYSLCLVKTFQRYNWCYVLKYAMQVVSKQDNAP